MAGDAAELAKRLACDAETVCRHYLSNGRREGHYWLVGDAQNTPGRSLYVRLRGPGSGNGAAGKWTDAADGRHGDLLDIIRLSCNLATIVEAMDEARVFLALPLPKAPKPVNAPRSSTDGARRLFAMGQSIRGTLAEAYLCERAITADLNSFPLRFHPSCYYSSGPLAPREIRPALLAAVTDPGGAITGVQRTWLDPQRATKAQASSPRKALGHILGNGVRFGAAPSEILIAGEGLETMLSLRSVLPNTPVVAALSANHLAVIQFPAGLKRLYVAQDNDSAGRRAVDALRRRSSICGIDVRVLVPIEGDFNEDLQHRGAGALAEDLKAQLAPEDTARFFGEPHRDERRRFTAVTS